MTGRSIMVLCYLFMGYNVVQGFDTFSREANLKMEKHIKLLNKLSIKTIEDSGELYDCVDFYKQPAFYHPLLKNFTFSYQKKTQSTRRENRKTIFDFPESLNIGLKDGGCPEGSVPIKRIKENDPIIAEHVTQRLDGSGIHYAVVQAQSNKFTGVEGRLCVYSPSTKGREYSAGRMKIQNGINGNEFIAFGWRKDPTRYGDSYTHLYIQTNTDSAKCIDLGCGFVLVAKDVYPGIKFKKVTIPGTITIQVRLAVTREKNGNWWLEIGEGENIAQVGYWPYQIFKELSDFGTFVDWGGEVYSPFNDSRPPMGSGSQPSTVNVDKFAFVANISVLDINGKSFDPSTNIFNDLPAYRVLDALDYDEDYKHTVLYGGPTRG